MRSPTLGTGLLAAVLTAALVVPGAQAEPGDPEAPSAADVRAAQDDAADAEDDVSAVRGRLADARAELDAASVKAAKAAEAWNGARWEAREARTAARQALADQVAADETLALHRDAYRDVVLTAGGTGMQVSAIGALIEADGMEALLAQTATIDRVQALFDQRRAAYDRAAETAETAAATAAETAATAETALATARAARDTAQAAADAASATEGRIERQTARLVRRLARLEGVSVKVAQKRQDAIAAEQEEERAAAAAAPAAPAEDAPAPPAPAAAEDAPADPAPADPGPAPAPSGGAQAAIAYARAQLGEPYRWGAAGPNAWDCSGLTAQAWAAGGKSLPHYSVAQYQQSTPITVGQLRPGDLVFWGDSASPSSIFHVALYAGDGRIIHAPRTGRPVTEESMYYWRTPDFFARP